MEDNASSTSLKLKNDVGSTPDTFALSKSQQERASERKQCELQKRRTLRIMQQDMAEKNQAETHALEQAARQKRLQKTQRQQMEQHQESLNQAAFLARVEAKAKSDDKSLNQAAFLARVEAKKKSDDKEIILAFHDSNELSRDLQEMHHHPNVNQNQSVMMVEDVEDYDEDLVEEFNNDPISETALNVFHEPIDSLKLPPFAVEDMNITSTDDPQQLQQKDIKQVEQNQHTMEISINDEAITPFIFSASLGTKSDSGRKKPSTKGRKKKAIKSKIGVVRKEKKTDLHHNSEPDDNSDSWFANDWDTSDGQTSFNVVSVAGPTAEATKDFSQTQSTALIEAFTSFVEPNDHAEDTCTIKGDKEESTFVTAVPVIGKGGSFVEEFDGTELPLHEIAIEQKDEELSVLNDDQSFYTATNGEAPKTVIMKRGYNLRSGKRRHSNNDNVRDEVLPDGYGHKGAGESSPRFVVSPQTGVRRRRRLNRYR
jgi:hypothetical protein